MIMGDLIERNRLVNSLFNLAAEIATVASTGLDPARPWPNAPPLDVCVPNGIIIVHRQRTNCFIPSWI